jgi:hypothetical protein
MTTQLNLKHLIQVYKQATPEETEQGKAWYFDAKKQLKESLPKNSCIHLAAKITAVLSPACPWERNLHEAISLLNADKPEEITVSTYGQNKAKALRILRGEEDLENKSKKTFSFYHNIAMPETSRLVTIDRHAFKALQGIREGGGVSVTSKQYGIAQEYYQILADLVDLKPHELQAITWLTFKRLKG